MIGLLPLLLLAAGVQSREVPDRERTVGAGSELLGVCRQEAEAHYAGLGEPVYQWTGAFHEYANVLYADGKLRVDGRDAEVHCRIVRNSRQGDMVTELVDPGK